MGKFKSWKYRSLFTNICTSTCLVGASAGIIFGVSAGTFKINYADLNNSKLRAAAANGAYSYYSQNITSKWNMVDGWNPNNKTVDGAEQAEPKAGSLYKKGEWWKTLHNGADRFDKNVSAMEPDKSYGDDISPTAMKKRYEYISMVIDGSTHSTMDRSFNQSLYNGIVNFIKNKNISSGELAQETETDPVGKNCAKSFKPGGDNTTEFLNIFKTVAEKFRLTGLAGFNHVTPLNAMGTYGNGETGDKFDGGAATNYRVQFGKDNSIFDQAGFLLIDGEVANNQQVASVLFRSDQPGFLAAISTCMYFYNNLETYHEGFKTLSVGAYGGTSIPTVTIYMGGFERGIEFFNEFVLNQGLIGPCELGNLLIGTQSELLNPQFHSINELPELKKLVDASKYKDDVYKLLNQGIGKSTQQQYNDIRKKLYDEYEIKMIKLGEASTHFSGTFASGDAIGVTKQFLNRGASAIIAVAGPQSLDSAQEIQNQNSKCIVVGVDSSMEEGDYQRSFKSKSYADKSEAPDNSVPNQKDSIIKFSAVKDMTSVTQKFAELNMKGQNFDVEEEVDGAGTGQPDPKKAICSVGYKTCGNVENGLISVSWDGWAPFLQAMRHTWGFANSGKVPVYGVDSSFDSAWRTAAEEYFRRMEKQGTTFKETFKTAVKELNQIQTYDKNKMNGEIYKNYSHIMKILGDVMNNIKIWIPKSMNVQVKSVDPKTHVTTYEPADHDEQMSILGWLERNMYFTC